MIKQIKVHPVESTSIILWGDDGNKEHTLIKARNCVASVISFDKRQIWEVYPYKEHSGEVRPIDYQDCSNAMIKMWMDNVVTDGEYNRIMDKLNAHWGKKDG